MEFGQSSNCNCISYALRAQKNASNGCKFCGKYKRVLNHLCNFQADEKNVATRLGVNLHPVHPLPTPLLPELLTHWPYRLKALAVNRIDHPPTCLIEFNPRRFKAPQRQWAYCNRRKCTLWVKKGTSILLPITLADVDGCSKFFHCWIQQEICNKLTFTLPTTP